MPIQKTSGQPFDTYAGGAGYADSTGGNESPAMADDAMPLTGAKTDPSVPVFGVDNMAQDMTKGGSKDFPVFGVDEMMQDMSGPGPA